MKTGVMARNKVLECKNLFRTSLLKKICLVVISFLIARASTYSFLSAAFAFYAAVSEIKVSRSIIFLSIILGMLTNSNIEDIYLIAASIFIFSAFSIPFKGKKTKVKNSILGFISVIIPSLFVVYMQGFLMYDMLKGLFNAILASILIYFFENIMTILVEDKKRYMFTNEEVISIAIILQICIAGFNNFNIFQMNLGNMLNFLAIILFSYEFGPGIGAATGVIAGLMMTISSPENVGLIGEYSFCGLLGGSLRKYGKMGTGLGIISANLIFTLILNQSLEQYLKEILISVGIFIFMPKTLMDSIVNIFNRSYQVGALSYMGRIKEITSKKLSKFSKAFRELSKTFSEISQASVITDKQDITALFDKVADKVCKNCGLKVHCWDMNFYDTYQAMFKITEQLELKGYVYEQDIPPSFIDKCRNISEFIYSVNNIYEIFRIDTVWKSKIGESRQVVSKQMDGLSKVISNLASEINTGIRFDHVVEDALIRELSNKEIQVNEVIAIQDEGGKYEVSIDFLGCQGRRECLGNIEKIVSDVLGKKMFKENRECTKPYKEKFCRLKFIEERKFKVITGVAKKSKAGNAVSGDSHSFIDTHDGKYIAALSDGMGSGQRAATQSMAAINMIENFMEAGFDKNTTIDIINSILVLKPGEDTFTTIDLSIIDLYEGQAEFIKVGAAPSFLKREKKIDMIRSVSLPAGILTNIEIEPLIKDIKSGDVIIMMSDGVADSFKREKSDYRYLIDFIQGIESRGPQDIANIILDQSLANLEGEFSDDMTVLTLKIWEKI